MHVNLDYKGRCGHKRFLVCGSNGNACNVKDISIVDKINMA